MQEEQGEENGKKRKERQRNRRLTAADRRPIGVLVVPHASAAAFDAFPCGIRDDEDTCFFVLR